MAPETAARVGRMAALLNTSVPYRNTSAPESDRAKSNCGHARSTTIAMPCPPPMHADATPQRLLRFPSSSTSV